MPLVHKEIVPDDLLVPKGGSAPKLPRKLRPDVAKWTRENIQHHWFLSLQEPESELMMKFNYRYNPQIIINFTCEFDAIAWKLKWL